MRISLIQSNDFPLATFQDTRDALLGCCPARTQLEHIGSTSIPDILCKPILDLLMIVEDEDALRQLDAHAACFEAEGFEVMGEFGIEERRYFRKFDAQGNRLVHVHAFTAASPHTTRHLAFRDFMRTHPARAAAYSKLKADLFAAHDGDREAYMDGKHGFITHHDMLAARWIATAHAANPAHQDLVAGYNCGELSYHELLSRGAVPLQSRAELLVSLFPTLIKEGAP